MIKYLFLSIFLGYSFFQAHASNNSKKLRDNLYDKYFKGIEKLSPDTSFSTDKSIKGSTEQSSMPFLKENKHGDKKQKDRSKIKSNQDIIGNTTKINTIYSAMNYLDSDESSKNTLETIISLIMH